MRRIPNPRLLWLALIALAVLASGAGWVVWRASRELAASKEAQQAEREFAFAVRPLAAPAGTKFEPVGSTEAFVQMVRWRGRLYLANSAGLAEYDLRGSLLRQFQAGRDLPASTLVAIAVGQVGAAAEPALILATADQGILAYDGRSFQQIYPASAEARAITTLLPVSNGRLLFGTKKRGVLLYDGKTIRELHPTLDHLYVQALAGSDLDLWIGTLDHGVKHWHAGTSDTFTDEQGLPDRQVQAIAQEGERTFVGTPLGIAEFNQGRFSRVLARGVFANALQVKDDLLWVGTEDQGVARIGLTAKRPSIGASRARFQPPALQEVRQILDSEDGALFLARDGVFEMKAKGTSWKQVLAPRPETLADRNISALAFDQNGQLWVGYFDRGLDLLPGGPIPTIHVEDEHVFCVNRIWPDAKGQTVEVATANGLVRFNSSGKPEYVLGRADGLIADHVTDIAPYQNGLAIATPAGITFLDSTGTRSMYTFHGLVNNHVYALGVSSDDLMVGTLGGLSLLEKGLLKVNYTAGRSGLKHNWITALAKVDDEWMVGTYGSGVMALDDQGQFHSFEKATGAMEINPNAMLVTASHVFAGTLGRGLYVFDRARRRWDVFTEGLPSGNVTALAAGGGYVYVGTDNGLVRIEERKLQP